MSYEIGIDVSKYQGEVDWAKVKASGQSFVFVRLGYINRDGSITVDPYFERNMKGAMAVGLQVGVYLYSYLETTDGARLAANRAMELLDEYGTVMPIALDYEHGALYQTISKEVNAAICNAFLSTVEKGGYLPLIYTYYAAAKAWLPLDEVNAPRWLANYTGRIGIDGVDIWQYSSSGSVPGIQGRVDMNRAYNGYWQKNANKPMKPSHEWEPLTGKVLEVFGTRRTEYFNSLDVNDVAGVLENGGRWPVTGILAGTACGYSWVTIADEGQLFYVALLDDRCRVVDAPAECGHEEELTALKEEVQLLREKIRAAKQALA